MGYNKSESKKKTVLEKVRPELDVINRQPYLVFFIKDEMRRYEIREKTTRIGRSSSSDIVIDDDRISWLHCTIHYNNGIITVEDQGSTNGTFIDGEKIQREEITTRSNLQLGLTVMKIEYKDQADIHFENDLFQKATTDPMTGIYNRGYFMNRAREEIAFTKRTSMEIGLVMLDIDFFKKINDSFGHQAGDYIIKQLAVIIDIEKRTEDLFGRYGGEEFIILIRGTLNREKAILFCERIRKAIEGYNFRFDDKIIHTTISLGLCIKPGGQIKSLDYLIKKADKALYKAKQNGRNRLECD